MTDITDKILRPMVAGSIAALNPGVQADGGHPLVLEFFQRMAPSETRQFYGLEYLSQCVTLLDRVPNDCLDNPKYLMGALLVHKLCHYPRSGAQTVRESAKLAFEKFFAGDHSVQIIKLIKATRPEVAISKRWDDDRAYMADITMYPYGLDEADYLATWKKIRFEFEAKTGSRKSVFKRAFQRTTLAHLDFLYGYSRRGGIYQTTHFRNLYGERAIENIARHREELIKP